jgi:hypothetical protein
MTAQSCLAVGPYSQVPANSFCSASKPLAGSQCTDFVSEEDSYRKFYGEKVPKDQLWRIFIDLGFQKDNNPFIFDSDRTTSLSGRVAGEPGYHNAMQNVFEHYLPSHREEKITVQSLIELHDKCVENVRTSGRQGPCDHARGITMGWCYPIPLKLLSPLVMDELVKKKLIGLDPESDCLCCLWYDGMVRKVRHWTLESVRTKAQELIVEYYLKIQGARSEEEKLVAIVDLCRSLEIFHLFPDGNQRTIAFALLTKLLVENRMSPTILENPAMFDGFMVTEKMVREVRKGQEIFTKKCRVPEPSHAIQT